MEKRLLFLFFLGLALAVAEETVTDVKSKRQISALPTIESCQKLRQECLKTCVDVINCTMKCPVCPIVTHVDPVPVSPAVKENLINRAIIVEGTNGTTHRYNYQYPGTTNHTTVIKLSNYINNTNLVNVPTHLNSTNVNHIHIYANRTEEGGIFGLGETDSGSCCFVVQPKTCRYGPDGLRCHHRRYRSCGPQCTSRIIHSHSRRTQARPSCFHTHYWPFVNCGAPQRDCSGCYDIQYSSYYDCTGCFDNGLEYGPLYRRGPVYRPFVNPEVDYDESGEATGDLMSVGVVEEDDEESTNSTNVDWGVVLKNCKVISSNESLTVENCTAIDRENPYAASPVQRAVRSPTMAYNALPLPMPMPYYGPPMEYFPQRRVNRINSKPKKQKVAKANKRRHRKVNHSVDA